VSRSASVCVRGASSKMPKQWILFGPAGLIRSPVRHSAMYIEPMLKFASSIPLVQYLRRAAGAVRCTHRDQTVLVSSASSQQEGVPWLKTHLRLICSVINSCSLLSEIEGNLSHNKKSYHFSIQIMSLYFTATCHFLYALCLFALLNFRVQTVLLSGREGVVVFPLQQSCSRRCVYL
jgi:hypothetical protein